MGVGLENGDLLQRSRASITLYDSAREGGRGTLRQDSRFARMCTECIWFDACHIGHVEIPKMMEGQKKLWNIQSTTSLLAWWLAGRYGADRHVPHYLVISRSQGHLSGMLNDGRSLCMLGKHFGASPAKPSWGKPAAKVVGCIFESWDMVLEYGAFVSILPTSVMSASGDFFFISRGHAPGTMPFTRGAAMRPVSNIISCAPLNRGCPEHKLG